MQCPGCAAEIELSSKSCGACGLDFEQWIESKWRKAVKPPRRARKAAAQSAGAAFAGLLLLALGAAAWRFWPRPEAGLSYVDERGTGRSLPGGRPALVGFWRDEDADSARLMRALGSIRRKYRGTELDVVGLCVGCDARRLREARANHWGIDMGLSLSAPVGEAVIVCPTGRLERVELSGGAPQEEIELALWRALPELRSAARSGLVNPVP